MFLYLFYNKFICSLLRNINFLVINPIYITFLNLSLSLSIYIYIYLSICLTLNISINLSILTYICLFFFLYYIIFFSLSSSQAQFLIFDQHLNFYQCFVIFIFYFRCTSLSVYPKWILQSLARFISPFFLCLLLLHNVHTFVNAHTFRDSLPTLKMQTFNTHTHTHTHIYIYMYIYIYDASARMNTEMSLLFFYFAQTQNCTETYLHL